MIDERDLRIADLERRLAVYNSGGFADADVLAARYLDQENDLAASRREVARLESVIWWALGMGDDFPDWPDTVTITGNPKFWWRKELRRRAALVEGTTAGERTP